MSRTFAFAALSALVGVAASSSCLPEDTRPTPATMNVTVTGSPLVNDGIPASAVDDGWSISFQRVLVSIGNSAVNGDACTDYAETDYRRLYDASVAQPQKLALIYGLGTCGFQFRMPNPNTDSILMQGVTDDEKTTMITPGNDYYTQSAGPVGVTCWVRGGATKGGVTKTFDWSFRLRRVRLHDCQSLADGTTLSLDMQGGATMSLDIEIHPEVFFQDRLDVTTAHLRFGPFAEADDKYGNGDGDVTLDELGQMSLAQAGITAGDLVVDGDAGVDEAGIDEAGVSWATTFEDFVYRGLFPRVTRVAGTQCQVDAPILTSSSG